MNLAEPTIADPDIDANVQMWREDRAIARGMPVIGDELASLVLDAL
jgi:hypothetical protein